MQHIQVQYRAVFSVLSGFFLIFFSGCTSLPSAFGPAPMLEPYSSSTEITASAADVEILALNQDMRDFLQRHVAGASSQQQKIKQLLYVIFHPGLVNLQYSSEKTKTAIQTYNSGVGNCISFASLYIAMARELGIDAHFQEVVTAPTWSKQGELLWVSRHVNVFGKLPHNGEYVIDFLPYLPYQRTRVQSSRVVSDSRAFAQYYNNIGAEYLAIGQEDRAFQFFKKALETNDRLSFVWSNMGTVYSRNNQTGIAEQAFNHALSLNSREYTAMNNLAKMYTRLGRDEEAQFYTARVKHFRERNPYYHFWLGENAYKEGRYRAAQQHFKRAIGKKSKEHEFHFALAKTYFHLGFRQKAHHAFEDARKHASDKVRRVLYNEPLEHLVTAKAPKQAAPEWEVSLRN